VNAKHDARADRLFLDDGDRPEDKAYILHDLVHEPVEQADRLHGDELLWQIHDLIPAEGFFNYAALVAMTVATMPQQDINDRFLQVRDALLVSSICTNRLHFAKAFEPLVRDHYSAKFILTKSNFQCYAR
jgi:hypothetical protein